MKAKKVLALGLTAAMAISLAACGDAATTGEAPAAASSAAAATASAAASSAAPAAASSSAASGEKQKISFCFRDDGQGENSPAPGWSGRTRMQDILKEDRKIRIVFTTNSSFEPVIANLILQFGAPVNILKANTRDVGGTAVGDMILGLPKDHELQEQMIRYLKDRGLAVEEVTDNVEQ